MFVRSVVMIHAFLALGVLTANAELSSSEQLLLPEDDSSVVSVPPTDITLSLYPADLPLTKIAGRDEQQLGAAAVGITEFPLVECPRCDETVFIDQESPLSYLRRLEAKQDRLVAAEEIQVQEPAKPGYDAHFHGVPRITLQSQLVVLADSTSEPQGVSGGNSLLDEERLADGSIETPTLTFVVAFLCGGGILGMFCLVVAAERTRFHPREIPKRDKPKRPRLAAQARSSTRPPWRCFLILGVAPGSSLEDIKQAYREKAFDYHPDRGGSVSRFLELTSAFEQAMAYASTYQLMVADARRREAEANGDRGRRKAEGGPPV